jgi:hypothetical protein
MANDPAKTPTTSLRVQLCGGAHLSNLGGFASPGRRLVFDINDSDETLPGPFGKRVDLELADEWGDGAKQTRIVVIGARGELNAQALQAQFDACHATA